MRYAAGMFDPALMQFWRRVWRIAAVVAAAIVLVLGLAMGGGAGAQGVVRGASAPMAGVAPPVRPVGKTLDAADLNAWLDGYMPYALHSGDIAGGVVVVVKDGAILTARGYGWADVAKRRPVDPDLTLFRVGSLSKLFTWTAVMQQVEAGKLDLDRDVNAYLDFRIPPYRGQPVTLRQIMTHTAGFELAVKDTITFNAPIALDRFLKRWTPERIFAPGTTPAYSNWGAALAGYIVQRASGEPFEGYVEHHILTPLGMRQASFRQPLPAPLAPFIALGYPRASGAPQGFEVIGPMPAGAMSASGTAMARFMIAHLDGGRGLMRPDTAAAMHRSALDRIDSQSLVPPLRRAELGFFEFNINGREVIGHGGDTQNFHSLLALFTDDGVGIFVSFNSAGRDGAAGLARDQLLVEFADRYFPGAAETRRVDPQTARTHALMMAGQWEGSGQARSNFLALAGLFGQTAVAQAADGGLSVPSLKDAGGAPQQWDEVAPFVWQSRTGHERLAAQVKDGRAVRWTTDSFAPIMVFDRVPTARSAAWVMPALYASLTVLLLTGLSWPVAWFVRLRYRAAMPLSGLALRAYRAVRIVSLLELAVLTGWMMLVAAMFSNISLISASSDLWLRLLQLSGAIVFVGAVGVAVWNGVETWRGGRHWTSRLWSGAIAGATITLLYVAWQFGLLAQGVNY